MAKPACNVDAVERLEAFGFDVKEVVSVTPEAILYLNKKGNPMTAWAVLKESEEAGQPPAIVYLAEPGFPAERGVELSA